MTEDLSENGRLSNEENEGVSKIEVATIAVYVAKNLSEVNEKANQAYLSSKERFITVVKGILVCI